MQLNEGNISILYAVSLRKTRAETKSQIAVLHGIPWISGIRQPPSENHVKTYIRYLINGFLWFSRENLTYHLVVHLKTCGDSENAHDKS